MESYFGQHQDNAYVERLRESFQRQHNEHKEDILILKEDVKRLDKMIHILQSLKKDEETPFKPYQPPAWWLEGRDSPAKRLKALEESMKLVVNVFESIPQEPTKIGISREVRTVELNHGKCACERRY